MSKDLLNVVVPAFEESATEVLLDLTWVSDKVGGTTDNKVEHAVGLLNGTLNEMARHTATNAKTIFNESETVGTVESNFNVGGVDLNVTTHRDYQEGEGEVIQYFTQAQVVTGLGSDIMEATAGIWED
jgi:hypothetical protein